MSSETIHRQKDSFFLRVVWVTFLGGTGFIPAVAFGGAHHEQVRSAAGIGTVVPGVGSYLSHQS